MLGNVFGAGVVFEKKYVLPCSIRFITRPFDLTQQAQYPNPPQLHPERVHA